jgi:PPK2 family polyphosphate:nucleotide phosphotransferase
MTQPLSVPPGTPIQLADFATDYSPSDLTKSEAKQATDENEKQLAELGYRLYAENKRSLLIVLQGMDTSGKDGTIRAIMNGLNPQSCRVTPFKQPSSEELDHDFLWRIHKAVPRKGNIGIFNRSHYEDVLVVRVHSLIPEAEWQGRYERINEFERMLSEGNTTIVKCFLHVSKEEQRERLQARVDAPNKRWKFSRGDLQERALWQDYQTAYEAVLSQCNTELAPWHIVPSDRKWVRNFVVSQLVVEALQKLAPQFPEPEDDIQGIVVE